MRAQEMIVELTQYACEGLIRNVKAMPAERHGWEPSAHSRSAHNMLWECAVVNDRFARFLKGEPAEPITIQGLGEMWAADPAADVETLITDLRSATASLCESILALEDDQFAEEVELGPDSPLPKKMLMWMGLRNMWYHLGQVNYIQSLYGDREMH